LIEVRQDGGDGHGVGREFQRRAGTHDAASRVDLRAVFGDQLGAHAVVGAGALDVTLHDFLASGLAGLDGALNVFDGGFFELEAAGQRGGEGEQSGDADCPRAIVLHVYSP
jgi:hypothetical protein